MLTVSFEPPLNGWNDKHAEVVFQNGPQHKKHCAYCPTIGDNTKEHISPKWLLRTVARNDGDYTVDRSLGRSDDLRYRRYDSRKSGRHIMASTVRKLCSDCNNNWSKSIVDAAKPIIERASPEYQLQKEEIARLRRQAVLFFINREFLDSPNQMTSYQTRRRFRLMQDGVPRGFRVWASLNHTTDFHLEWNQFSKFAHFCPFGCNYSVPVNGFGGSIFILGGIVFYVELVENYLPNQVLEHFPYAKAIPNFTLLDAQRKPISLNSCDDFSFVRAAQISMPPGLLKNCRPLGLGRDDN